MAFTAVFLAVFMASEHYPREEARRGRPSSTSNSSTSERPTRSRRPCFGLTKPYRKLVAIRSPQNLFMLEKALAETDPETTDVVVMTAKLHSAGQQTLRPAAISTTTTAS